MKYLPSLPEKNDNVSHNHPLSEFALLSAGLILFFGIVYLILGLLVDLAAEKISYETEAALFQALSSRVDYFDPQNDDLAEEKQRVQQIVDDLQTCTDLPYAIQVHIVKSDETNAIALPGGHIAVFTGLLQAVPQDNGLAFVLAHELGHFQNRDHLRSLGRSLVFYSLSAMLTGGNSSISGLLAPTFGLTAAQYSQARESMADRIALDTCNCRFGNINGAVDFFRYIIEMKLDSNLQIFHYFSSHPETQKRIDELKAYADSKGYQYSSF